MKRIENIPGFPGYYITSCGRVWSYKRNKFREPQKDKDGYPSVLLSNNGKLKNFRIHRLVAMAYVPNPENLPEVDHIDRNKENNCVNNLRWVSREENNKNKKYPQRQIICIETGKVFESQAAAAREMNLSNGHINDVLKGRLKTTGGYHFEYINVEGGLIK